MNSYILSPRSVTAQPMGMPLRILKFAMDFFARVMMGFLPGDLAEFDRRGVQQLGVLAGFAEADVQR